MELFIVLKFWSWRNIKLRFHKKTIDANKFPCFLVGHACAQTYWNIAHFPPAKRSAALPALKATGFFFISFYFLPVFALLIALLPLPPFTLVLVLFCRFSPFLSIGPFFKEELHSLYFNFIDEPPHPTPHPKPRGWREGLGLISEMALRCRGEAFDGWWVASHGLRPLSQ